MTFIAPRRSTNGSRHNFIVPRHNFIVPRTNFNGSRTNFNGSRTNFNGSRTNFNGSRHNFIVPRTNFNGSRHGISLAAIKSITTHEGEIAMSQDAEFRPKSEEIPGQQLPYPAKQSDMTPAPDSDLSNYKPAGKLEGKTALITGADSGIGRAVAIAFAMEGANVAVLYNENDSDAQTTHDAVRHHGKRCLLIKADVRDAAQCRDAVAQTVSKLGALDILVNNAAYQKAQEDFLAITEEQLRRTFETNIFGYFFMAQAAVPHLKAGDCIINTCSIVGMTGNPILVDYSSSKGAIIAFTKSLAANLAEKEIRVNSVAPGPVWTPNIPATMPPDEVKGFGHEVLMKRPGQPEEVAPAYVFLASADSSFITGAVIEVTGGKLSA